MCCDGPSPEHKRAVMVGGFLFPFELLQGIFQILVIIAVGLVATSNVNFGNRRMLGEVEVDLLHPATIAPALSSSFEYAVMGTRRRLNNPAARCEKNTGTKCTTDSSCGSVNSGLCTSSSCTCLKQSNENWCCPLTCSSDAQCKDISGILSCKNSKCEIVLPQSCQDLGIKANDSGDIAAPSYNKDEFTGVVGGVLGAAWAGMILNFLMLIGLFSILCCCTCARQDAGSCWWWYLTIVSTLAAAVIIYPVVVMTQLTNTLGNAKQCLEDLTKLASEANTSANLPVAGDVFDSIKTYLTIVTVFLFLTLFLRLLLAILLWFCTPSASKLAERQGDMQMTGGNLAYNASGGQPIVKAGV